MKMPTVRTPDIVRKAMEKNSIKCPNCTSKNDVNTFDDWHTERVCDSCGHKFVPYQVLMDEYEILKTKTEKKRHNWQIYCFPGEEKADLWVPFYSFFVMTIAVVVYLNCLYYFMMPCVFVETCMNGCDRDPNFVRILYFPFTFSGLKLYFGTSVVFSILLFVCYALSAYFDSEKPVETLLKIVTFGNYGKDKPPFGVMLLFWAIGLFIMMIGASTMGDGVGNEYYVQGIIIETVSAWFICLSCKCHGLASIFWPDMFE